MYSKIFVYCIFYFYLPVFLFNNQCSVAAKDEPDLNDRPIIGILAQESSYKLNEIYSGKYNSYIAASYVKYIESAGARVVPIWIGKPETYYKDILSKVNGVLFPGGNTYFNQSNGYADAGEFIYKIAKEFNENNDYFPIWGTCLGFELLTYLEANRREHRTKCNIHNQALPLEFTPNFKSSRLFKNAPSDVIEILEKQNVTANFHSFCITEEDLIKVNVISEFFIISHNDYLNGKKLISIIEHVNMPFYGVQFHPEKNPYEWIRGKNIPHSADAIIVSNYFANFFVNEARKNFHKFNSIEEENSVLIYNYPVTYTGIKGSSFAQCYLFNDSSHKSIYTPYLYGLLVFTIPFVCAVIIRKFSHWKIH